MEVTLTLRHGDCLEIMKGLPEKSVDLIICDLPYGCLASGFKGDGGEVKRFLNGKETPNKIKTEGGCAWDIKIDLKAFWEQIRRIRRSDHSPTIHFCTTKFGFELHASNPEEFRYDLVWDKQRGVSFLSANKMPMRSHEMIYVFSKAGAFYNRIDVKGDFKPYSAQRKYEAPTTYVVAASGYKQAIGQTENKRCVLSVINTNNAKQKTNGHPTEKPCDLYRFLIDRYCPPGGIVLDPTAGSFNSVFTAYEMDRSAIGIEKDDKFYKKAEERMDALNNL
jgi:site-specific DNA-methyltransferase (adenine-specific)